MSNKDTEDLVKKQKLKEDLEEYERQARRERTKDSLENIFSTVVTGISDAIDKANNKGARRPMSKNDVQVIKHRMDLQRRKMEIERYEKTVKRAKRKQITRSVFFGGLGFFLTGTMIGLTFLPALGIGAAIGAAAYFLNKPVIKVEGIDPKNIALTSEWPLIMHEANLDLEDIFNCMEKAPHEGIREKAGKLYKTGVDIIDYIRDNPGKLMAGKKFLSYYLDTAAKICRKYMEFTNTISTSAEANEMFEHTDKGLGLLVEGFEKQFSKLMADDLLDIETDIAVLENTIKWDGLK